MDITEPFPHGMGDAIRFTFTSEDLEAAWVRLQGEVFAWVAPSVPEQLEYQEGMVDRKEKMHPLWMWDEIE